MRNLSAGARVMLALAFLVVLGMIIYFADTGTMPKMIHRLYAFPYGDKVGHFVLMGLLTLAFNLAFSYRRIALGSRRLLLGSVLAFIVVTIEELTQAFFQTRSASPLDLSASYLGIFSASLFIGLVQKRSIAKHEMP